MVGLIGGGVGAPGGVWADMGAGTGNFTWALRELLGPAGTIYAIDRDGKAIERQRARLLGAPPGAAIIPRQADITRSLDLPPLDGVLAANLLHFLPDQPGALRRLAGYLRPGGRLLAVEYDLAGPLRYVPYPLPFNAFGRLAEQAGLGPSELVGRRVSPSSGVAMYAALALKR